MIAAVLAVPSTQYLVPSKEQGGSWFETGRYRYWVLGIGYCSSLSRDNADIGKIAIAFRIVQTVAHDEFIRDSEANIVAL